MSRFFRKCHQLAIASFTRFQHTKITSDRIKSVREMYEREHRNIDGVALFLLVIPMSAFGLGTWQVQRKRWKEGLMENLYKRTHQPPVDFPYDLSELNDMEYQPVRVVGTFDHSKELYVGPRSLIKNGDSSSNAGSIISSNQTGFYVVTPLTLSDRDLTILVNRGWVPRQEKLAKFRPAGQVEGEVELVGIVRHTEERQPMMPQNKPGSGLWLYRDLNKMAEYSGAVPIFVDAVESSTVPGGPIGGQTRISLRNEHLSYIMTWYGLSGVTAFMWYRHFIAKVKLAV